MCRSSYTFVLKSVQLLCFLALLPGSCLRAQQKQADISQLGKTVDSLNAVIRNSSSDTVIARTYITISGLYYASKPDTVIPICRKAFALAAEALVRARNKKERLSLLLTQSAALSNMGIVQFNRGQVDSGLRCLEQGLKIAAEIGDKKELANAMNNVAAIYFKKGETKSTLEYLQRALAIQQELDEQKGMAFTLNNIAQVYEHQGQIRLALDYYFRAQKMQEAQHNKLGIGSVMNNIAALYMKQNDPDKALEYYAVSLKAREEAGDKRGIGQCLTNMGHAYEKKGEVQKALEFYKKGEAFYREIGFRQGIAASLSSLAGIYAKQGQAEKATAFFLHSISISDSIQDKKGVTAPLNALGTLLLRLGKKTEAAIYAGRALRLAQETGNAESIRDAHFILAGIDSAAGRPRESLAHYRQYISIRDSLSNAENTKKIVQQQMQYDFDKKEAEKKAIQDKKDALAAGNLEQQKRQRNYFIAGFVLVLLLAVFILRSFLLKQKANRLLEEKNRLIEEQKAVVEEKQKEILDSIHYARRIQKALITSERYIDRALGRMRKNR